MPSLNRRAAATVAALSVTGSTVRWGPRVLWSDDALAVASPPRMAEGKARVVAVIARKLGGEDIARLG